MYKKLILFLFIFIFFITCKNKEAINLKISEQILHNINESSWEKDSFKLSPDGRHYAYFVKLGGKRCVYYDGKQGNIYDEILYQSIYFSPDSQHLAYAAQLDNKCFVVLDGVEKKKYDGIQHQTPIFSPDSQHIAYSARYNGKWIVVVDDKEHKNRFDILVSTPFFSSDNKFVIYLTQNGSKQKYMVVDDKVDLNIYYETLVLNPAGYFAPDGRTVVFQAFLKNKEYLIINGERREYEAIMGNIPEFSPDSRHYAYAVKEGAKRYVIFDGIPQKKYDGIGENSLKFSPDGKRFIYTALTGTKWIINVNGQESEKFDEVIGLPIFSPDSRHIAYAVKSGDKYIVIIDGKKEKQYDAISRNIFFPQDSKIVFSPDSNIIAYSAIKDKKQFIVIGGIEIEQPVNYGITLNTLIFSSDNKHWACVVQSGIKNFVILDGQKHKTYDNVLHLFFSTDNKHLSYTACLKKKWFIVLDGNEGTKYDTIIEPKNGIFYDSNTIYDNIKGKSMFTASNKVSYTAINDNKIIKVEQEILE